MDEKIDLKGLDKAEVLAALYNGSRAQGIGVLHASPAVMTKDVAAGQLSQGPYFDYVFGRVMKVHLDRDSLDPRLYDRDLGVGAAKRAIDGLRKRTA